MIGRLLSLTPEKQEDKQTALIFSTLLHLPDDECWNIIRDSCYDNELPENPGKIEFYEFWPHWPPDKNHQRYVEPDLFIRYENFDLIIEAKRYDDNQQYHEQWKSEYISYRKKYGKDKKNVALIAVGGIYALNISSEKPGKIIIQKCRWRGLLNTLYSYSDKYGREQHANYDRIVKDCIEYLEYFNFKRLKWLKEILGCNYKISPSANILSWLKSAKGKELAFFGKLNNSLTIETNSINTLFKWRIV
jgi:hypothetical protein